MHQRRTRIDAVMDEVRSKIASRSYPRGARLPSVRAQAKAMGLSISTVVEAYDRLAAEGTISARQGAGFFVSGPVPPLSLSETGPRLDREVDPLWVSRQSLESESGTLKPGCGWLPASWMFEDGIRRALRTTARASASVLTDYATPRGLMELRQVLSRRMAGKDIEAPPEQIMLTDSGTQGIDLICRFFLEPGDTVLVDDPCYFNFHAVLRAQRVNIVGVPMTPSGPDIAAFESALQEHSPRLYITNSGIHNPTGATLSPVIAHRLLTLADNADLIIVEDDVFHDFENCPAPRLAAFDGLARVIHIGSFSKTISASLRCGYIAAREDWIEGLLDLKIATSFGSSQLASAVLLAALTDSSYRKHMEAVRIRLAKAMDKTIARLLASGITPWIVPESGMFVWCQLPGDANAADIARTCLKNGVVLAPGSAFSHSPMARRSLRFNAAQSQDDRVFDVLKDALTG
jgi:DNA-binding transcriptional MocR family regulator